MMRLRPPRSRLLRAFVGNEWGNAAEFALILPIGMLFFFGIMDAGRWAYAFNRGEKAVQIGARWAVVTDPIEPVLASESYVGKTIGAQTLIQGDRIPLGAFGKVTCTSASCTCATTPCPSGIGTPNSTAFNALLQRMQEIMPDIDTANLKVDYSGSGLGYAGNPNGMDIAPFVTVRLEGMTFSPVILFGNAIDLPDFSYTLTMEDGQGTSSN